MMDDELGKLLKGKKEKPVGNSVHVLAGKGLTLRRSFATGKGQALRSKSVGTEEFSTGFYTQYLTQDRI